MKDALFLLAVGILGAVICTRPRPVQPARQPRPRNLFNHRLWYRSL